MMDAAGGPGGTGRGTRSRGGFETDGITIGGIGVDAVDVARLRLLLARRPSIARRLFTPDELVYVAGATDPAPRMATRFAAKEATMKALGVGLGSFRFTEVEVVRVGLGAPTLVLRGAAAERAERCGVTGWHLSLTHTDQLAMAFVVGERPPGTLAPMPIPMPMPPGTGS
ncbi:MAG: holo-ACP synthase [Acidimicrobiales bacterium]